MKKLTSRFATKQKEAAAAAAAPAETRPNQPDNPETNALRGIKSFCESGSAGNVPGEEILYLPVIVEAAESSPQAAAVAAQEIRKLLGKENYARPNVQYNSIMLIRILANNPGQTFTKNLDLKFATTVKELLRSCRDPSVQQIMRETLDALEAEKAYDENLIGIMAMWRKEKGAPEKGGYAQYQITQARNFAALNSWNRSAGGPGIRNPNWQLAETALPATLPSPEELAGRVEEGKTTAKLLIQLIQSTPIAEVTTNDLIKEFSQRGVVAHRSLQGYMHCTPPPDADTLQTLIETCEQLNLASSKHQRAILQARRALAPPPVAAGQAGVSLTASAPSQVAAGAQSAPLQVPADFRIPQPQSSVPAGMSPFQHSASVRQSAYSTSQPSPLVSYADTIGSRSPGAPPSPVSPPRAPPTALSNRYGNNTYSPPLGPPAQVATPQRSVSPGRAPSPSSYITRPSTIPDDDLYSDGDASTNLYDTSPARTRLQVPDTDPDAINSPSDYYRNANPFSNAHAISEPTPAPGQGQTGNPDFYTHPAHRNTNSTSSINAIAPNIPQPTSLSSDPYPTQPQSHSASNNGTNDMRSISEPQALQQQQQQRPQPYYDPALAPRQSYINRQEDAVGRLMMSGAGSPPPNTNANATVGAKQSKMGGWRHRK